MHDPTAQVENLCHEHDRAGTGKHHNRNRDYDAVQGRFTSVDPKGFAAGDVDLYRYVGNGPVNGVDAWGLEGIRSRVKGFGKSFLRGVGFGEYGDQLVDGVEATIDHGVAKVDRLASGNVIGDIKADTSFVAGAAESQFPDGVLGKAEKKAFDKVKSLDPEAGARGVKAGPVAAVAASAIPLPGAQAGGTANRVAQSSRNLQLLSRCKSFPRLARTIEEFSIGRTFQSSDEQQRAWRVYQQAADSKSGIVIGHGDAPVKSAKDGWYALLMRQDHWTPAINDAWVDGAAHAGKPIKLVTPFCDVRKGSVTWDEIIRAIFQGGKIVVE